jgi:hypothetical protein
MKISLLFRCYDIFTFSELLIFCKSSVGGEGGGGGKITISVTAGAGVDGHYEVIIGNCSISCLFTF